MGLRRTPVVLHRSKSDTDLILTARTGQYSTHQEWEAFYFLMFSFFFFSSSSCCRTAQKKRAESPLGVHFFYFFCRKIVFFFHMQIKRCRRRIWKKQQPTFAGVGGGRGEKRGIPEWHWKKYYILQKVIKKKTHAHKTHECMYESEFVLETHMVLARRPTRKKKWRGNNMAWTFPLFKDGVSHEETRAGVAPPPPLSDTTAFNFAWNTVIASTLQQLSLFAHVSFSCLVWRRFIKGILRERTTTTKNDSFLQTLNAKNNNKGTGGGDSFV